MDKDYYSILGVARDAPSQAIMQAYWDIEDTYDPNTFHVNPDADPKISEIKEAYDVLKDHDKRSEYDQANPDAGRAIDNDAPLTFSGTPRGKNNTENSQSAKKKPVLLLFSLAALGLTGLTAAAYLMLHHPSKINTSRKLDTKTAAAQAYDPVIFAIEKAQDHKDYYYTELHNPTLRVSDSNLLIVEKSGSSLLAGWTNCNNVANSPQENLANPNDQVFYCDSTSNYMPIGRYRIHTSPPPGTSPTG